MVPQLITASACIFGICLCIPHSSLQTLRKKRVIKLVWKKLMREQKLKTTLEEYYTIKSIKKIKNGFDLRIITPIGFTNKQLLELEEILNFAYCEEVKFIEPGGSNKELHVLIPD